ncbi:Polyprenyl synthetase [Thermodesulfatator indicus DSM 15286]|uniref:Polyprenyl synthetase n=1 Tax=Thermodesulfatator indicus (strain DSM 15286 / JCM 11887 / CIR29812) TaxID=667014 RepID=F8ABC9_THEID|nr:polyprenyl synthetase family protein [Thermodesulfatator indicus]AEH44439.1 Polyprenyl synthetase [Thermodesulfatator indicus DSM 15286]
MRTKQEIIAAIAPDLEKIEETLSQNFASYVPFINEVSRHILFAGGKRLRPLLMVLSARLCGEPTSAKTYRLSVLFEYLHAATLLHDDVVDGAKFRRGRKAAHHLWGNQAVILVGDFLYSRAIRIAVEEGNMDVLDVISQTTTLMSEGEVLQLINLDNVELTEEKYFDVIFRKTAALMAAACEVGAIYARGNSWERPALKAFGTYLGYAFQITDDLLDYLGVKDETGKDIGTDFKEGKVTLPYIIAMERAEPTDREELIALIKEKEAATPENFKRACELMKKYDAFSATHDRAKEYVEKACQELAKFEPSPARDLLIDIAQYVLTRKH